MRQGYEEKLAIKDLKIESLSNTIIRLKARLGEGSNQLELEKVRTRIKLENMVEDLQSQIQKQEQIISILNYYSLKHNKSIINNPISKLYPINNSDQKIFNILFSNKQTHKNIKLF